MHEAGQAAQEASEKTNNMFSGGGNGGGNNPPNSDLERYIALMKELNNEENIKKFSALSTKSGVMGVNEIDSKDIAFLADYKEKLE